VVKVTTEEREIRRRGGWVQLFAETSDAGLVCRRCGISRPTLRKWWVRVQAQGMEGLTSRSRRPHESPRRALTSERVHAILILRDERNLGPKRIQAEWLRLHNVRLSSATIWKVLRTLTRERRFVAGGHPNSYDDTIAPCQGTVFKSIP
jgi:transposase-like protein